MKESDMHRQLGNLRRWRRAGHAPQRTRGAVPAAGPVLGGPRGGNATRGVASTGVARVRRPCGDKAPPSPGSCPPLPLHARAGTAQDAYGTESQAPGDLLDLGVNLAKGPQRSKTFVPVSMNCPFPAAPRKASPSVVAAQAALARTGLPEKEAPSDTLGGQGPPG